MAGHYALIAEMAEMIKRTIICCLFIFCLGSFMPNYGLELSRYNEKVILHGDGSAEIRLFLTVIDSTEPKILIPVRHASLLNVQAQKIAPTAVRVVENKGNHFLALDLPGAGGSPLKIEISFQVENYFENSGSPAPFGNKELDYRFVNVTFERIGEFCAELILPSGYVFNAISSFSPKPKKSGMALPYTISRQNKKNVGSITVQNIKLGDEIALSCTFKSSKKSLTLLWALIALAAAYLIFFRDILKNGKTVSGTKR
jgi:hypothetical protein